MQREAMVWFRLGAAALDAVTLTFTWWLAVLARDQVGGDWLAPFGASAHLPLGWLAVPMWLTVLYARGSYERLRRRGLGEAALHRAVSSLLAALGMAALLFLLNLETVSRVLLALFALLSVPALVASRSLHLALLRWLRRRRFDLRRVLLVGRPGEARPFLAALDAHPEWAMDVAGRVAVGRGEREDVPQLGDLSVLPRVLRDETVHEVYVTGRSLDADQLTEVAALCQELGVTLSLDGSFLGYGAASATIEEFDGWSLVSLSSHPPREAERALKRALDIGGALMGLVLLAPALCLVAAIIRSSDGGPVLFVQERVGRYGRRFGLWKFRTMVIDAEERQAELEPLNEADGPVFKMREDPRVTPTGRWLRRWSIDELPQLVNVLAGHMSLVGPRPPLPREVACYERWQLRRLSVRPGLTGPWQVAGRSDLAFEEWMALDLQYVDEWTLRRDVLLLLRTIPAVLRGVGAR